VATGVSRTTTTNAAGFYVLIPLQIGQYKVTASHTGFTAHDRTGVTLDADASVTVNISLSVGASTQTITVVDKATTLHTETGAVNTVISGALVQELALNGRNFSRLLTLGPGVVSEQTDLRMGWARRTVGFVPNICRRMRRNSTPWNTCGATGNSMNCLTSVLGITGNWTSARAAP